MSRKQLDIVTKHGTADLTPDQIEFFDKNDINFSRWIRKRFAEWIDKAKSDPKLIANLKLDDDKIERLKDGRTIVHKTMSIDVEQLKFFKDNGIDGKMSLLMRRTIDNYKKAIEYAEKGMYQAAAPTAV